MKFKYVKKQKKKLISSIFILVLFSLNIIISSFNYSFYEGEKEKFDHTSIKTSQTSSIILDWRVTWGGSEYEHCFELATDSSDNIYVVGATESYGAGNKDVCVLKYNNTGDLLWYRTWGGADYDYATSIAVDSTDCIYVGGNKNSNVPGGPDCVLIKYNSSGSVLWQKSWASYDWDYCSGITVDKWDNVYIAGTTQGFGAIGADMFVVKYNSSGDKQWSKLWGGGDTDQCRKIDVDSVGDVYLAGFTESYGAGISDLCLVKFDSLGNYLWNNTWGGTSWEDCWAVKCDSFNNVYIGGRTYSFGAGRYDIVVVKYDSQGANLWNTTWGGGGNDECEDIALDSAEYVYVIGSRLLKFSDNGTLQWDYPTGGKALSFDSWDNIYVAGSSSNNFFLSKFLYSIPQIRINNPRQNEVFGKKSPYYNISLAESNLDSTWYSLNDGINYTFSGTSGKIDQTAWDLFENEKIILKFYANNSFGNESYKEVAIWKDIDPPDITIISPLQNQLFGIFTFNFELSITADDLDITWYSLNDGLNYTFIGNTGKIDKNAWESCENGTVSIKFYVNDTYGNLAREEVKVRKDIANPDLHILEPEPYQLFGVVAPNFELILKEDDLNSTWYSLNNGLNYTFTGSSGTIDQTAWDLCENGTVTIRFYINDSVGRTAFKDLIVLKDSASPNIKINLPEPYHEYGLVTFSFDIIITEAYLNSTCYSLNDGKKYYFEGTSGRINPHAWDECKKGVVILRFYANDSLGNLGFKDVLIYKDTVRIVKEWDRSYGLGDEDRAYALALDSSNNIYLGGYSDSNILGGDNMILIKYDYSGTYKWKKEWDASWPIGISDDHGRAVVIDSNNNIYIAGHTHKQVNGPYDICIVKYNHLGAVKWERTWGYGGNDYAYGMVIDSSDNLYIAGQTGGDMLLIKYNSQGVQQWNKTWGGTYTQSAYALILDSSDNIYLAGTDMNPLQPATPTEMCLVKFDNSGVELWNRTWGGPNSDQCYAIALDSSGNIYMAGGTWSFGAGNYDYCLVKYDSSGNYLWNRTWGGNNYDVCYGIAIDSSDKIYLTGKTYSFGNGKFDMALVKFDDSGEQLWNKTWGGSSDDIGTAIAFDSSENIFISGYRYSEMFLIKYDNSAPELTIISPIQNQLFGNSTPSYEISIIEPKIHTIWYSLNGYGTYIVSSNEGNIDQNAWNRCENGTVTIRFYVNDTGGRSMFKEIIVRKETSFPEITIHSPTHNKLFGNNSPIFELSVLSDNLNTTWYSLNDGQNYFFSGTIGSIDQAAWALCDNGTVVIKFYANNTVGSTAFKEIIVRKDSTSPMITILSPMYNKLFGETPPNFELLISEGNLDSTWYSLNGGISYMFNGLTGTINQVAWNACGNGTVIIRFYANDTLSNLGFNDIMIKKDIDPPTITIINPTPNQICGNNTINFELSILEGNLDTSWYSLNGGNNYSFTETTGMINQTAWDNCFDGNIILRFYVNDSAGNLAHDEVIIIKDTTPPNITVNNPLPDSPYGGNSPSFNVLIQDPHLDLMWYTINTGLHKYMFINNDTIDQDAWNLIPNGPVILTFYANDSLGNIGSQFININKQAYPEIFINLPLENGLFGFNAPAFNMEIYNISVDTMWYSIDDGLTNFTFSNNDTINQGAWDLQLSGLITLTFSVNSTAGDIFQESIIVEKDVNAPQISIITPIQDEVLEISPAYEMTITEANLDKIWYTFDGETNKIFITELIGVIDLTLWNQLPNGYVTIRFYANDTLGNISFDEVIVIKDIPTTNPPPEGIPGYNVIILLGMISLIAVFIIKRIAKEI